MNLQVVLPLITGVCIGVAILVRSIVLLRSGTDARQRDFIKDIELRRLRAEHDSRQAWRRTRYVEDAYRKRAWEHRECDAEWPDLEPMVWEPFKEPE